MNYLIFRTDRIGDFLITLPLIKSIKRNDLNAIIDVVTSTKNETQIKANTFVDNTFLLRSNSFIDKINLFFKLIKKKYDFIIVADKKNRSILISLFLLSKKKIFNISKTIQKKLLSFFYKDVFLDNDQDKDTSIKKIIEMNCASLEINFEEEDYKFFSVNQFVNHYKLNKLFDLDKSEYLIFHYDEKWELDQYSKVFNKAKNLTNIKIDINPLKKFLVDLARKKSMDVVVTTGNLETSIINQLKEDSRNLSSNLYNVSNNIHLIVNQDFESISHLISRSKLFISCHGALTHVASCYNVEILDIIEKGKKNHYQRITNHMKKYKSLNRESFNQLSKNIIDHS